MPNYIVLIIPQKGQTLSLIARDAYEANELVAYYEELGCLVTTVAPN